MSGAAGNFIRKTAADAVRANIDQYNTLTSNMAGGSWFIGKVSSDKNTVEDPAGITYKLTYTGQVQQFALARRLSANQAHVIGSPALKQLYITSNPANAYTILSKSDGTSNQYYICNLNDANDPTKYYLIDILTVAGVSSGFTPRNTATVRFSPSGKNLFVAFDSNPSGSISTAGGATEFHIKWGWALNWALSTDVHNNKVVSWKSLSQSDIVLNLGNLPLPPPADPVPPPILHSDEELVSTTVTPSQSGELFYIFSNYETSAGPKTDIVGIWNGEAASLTNFLWKFTGTTTPIFEFFQTNTNAIRYLISVVDNTTATQATQATVITQVPNPEPGAPISDYLQTTTLTGDLWEFIPFSFKAEGATVFKFQNTSETFVSATSKRNLTFQLENAGYWIPETNDNYLVLSTGTATISIDDEPTVITNTHLITFNTTPPQWLNGIQHIKVRPVGPEAFITLDDTQHGGLAVISKWGWDSKTNLPTNKVKFSKPMWDESIYTIQDYTIK